MPDTYELVQRLNTLIQKIKFNYRFKALALISFFVTLTQWLFAQSITNEKKVQMADGLRSNGKIYVVVAVLLTVLAGLFIYIISVDRKVTKLEKDNQS